MLPPALSPARKQRERSTGGMASNGAEAAENSAKPLPWK
uniref:Uncharacterized protein n=1 Tax=Arundo donax TaxID=35708 RepID=A0A0A9ENP2_ARUDO